MKGALGGGLPIRHEFHDEVINQWTDHYVFLALQGQSMSGNLPLVRSSEYKVKAGKGIMFLLYNLPLKHIFVKPNCQFPPRTAWDIPKTWTEMAPRTCTWRGQSLREVQQEMTRYSQRNWSLTSHQRCSNSKPCHST